MAEARQAAIFATNKTDEDHFRLDLSRGGLLFLARSAYQKCIYKLDQAAKKIRVMVYPATELSLYLFIVVVGICVAFKFPLISAKIHKFGFFIPVYSELIHKIIGTLLFSIFIWLACSKLLQFFLRYALLGILLRVTQETSTPRNETFRMQFYEKFIQRIIKFLIGRKITLYSLQNCLPFLPVPKLNNTVHQYLESVKHLLTEEKYESQKKRLTEFMKFKGKILQIFLWIRYLITDNYVSEWWEKYVYLHSRSPLMINSNFYIADGLFKGNKKQASRAATAINKLLIFKNQIEKETLKPILFNGMMPLCSEQYRRAFNTTRIPGVKCDTLHHLNLSNHIIVLYKGNFYKIVLSYLGMPLSNRDFENQMNYILNNSTEAPDHEKFIPALTALDRTEWANIRKKYFLSNINAVSLSEIENACFFMSLDEDDFAFYLNDNDELTKSGKSLIHGNGHNRWFDKSINAVINRTGRCGLNVEHSWADAPIMAQNFEIICDELMEEYNEDGSCKGVYNVPLLPPPKKLEWNIDDECQKIIIDANTKAVQQIEDLDLAIAVLTDITKGTMKKLKTSPDSLIQIALQLSYYKDMGCFCLTYEAAMVRSFKNGRTETVRSCSLEVTNFVKAYMNPSISKEEKIRLYRIAEKTHIQRYRIAMTGKGYDRHLFALYVASKYLGMDIPVLGEILSEPWQLSTSQTPLNLAKSPFYNQSKGHASGGGFGPASPDGYGVSYIFSEDYTLGIHVSSKISCPKTNSARFLNTIKDSIRALHNLLAIPC